MFKYITANFIVLISDLIWKYYSVSSLNWLTIKNFTDTIADHYSVILFCKIEQWNKLFSNHFSIILVFFCYIILFLKDEKIPHNLITQNICILPFSIFNNKGNLLLCKDFSRRIVWMTQNDQFWFIFNHLSLK